MHLNVEITEKELRELVRSHLSEKLGDVSFEASDVKIQVKSKQNYKSEWEEASFRAVLTKSV